ALLMRGYDLYLLAIAKLLNSNYSRLLSFYFHTLIQQCRFFLRILVIVGRKEGRREKVLRAQT
ncbi:MAG: hypothetical protein QNJ68_12625, partial [Microcoleaceae cyanobacterium MO_207.B10]|nr:hypothetical protein [Microcoleaceae cyanobacterium MO_207.B10]